MVTGGAGFIGSHLVDALVAGGMRVRIIDNFATGLRDYVNPAAELIEADIRSAAAIAPAFAGVETVFHVAAMPRIPLSIERPVETHMVNVVGTLNVLVAARDAKVRRVIYSSSSSVYGTQDRMPLVETMVPSPLNPYALQKFVGEQYAAIFHRLYGLESLCLRYFNAFGPRMTGTAGYVTVIHAFLDLRRKGLPLIVHGDGEQSRDFTHVSDIVRANLLAMDCAIADGRPINIGHGVNVTVNRIAELIGGPIEHRPPRPGDMRHTLADSAEAARVLGWHPQVSVEQGLAELMKS